MLRWVWQILRAEGGLWLQLVQAKYLQGRPLLAYEHREGSQFWKSIQRIKHVIRNGLSVSIGNTEGTLFGLDPWVGVSRRCMKFPNVFSICSDLMVLVSMAAHDGHWNIFFRWTFGTVESVEWANL